MNEIETAPEPTEIPVTPLQIAPRQPSISSRLMFNLASADPMIRAVLDPRTMPGEQFRFLRAKLGQLRRQRDLKTLLVTSSFPSEGKTFTACCLAGILAQEPGKQVLLVDADLRRSRASQNLGIDYKEKPEGLVQVLEGTKSLDEALMRSSDMDFFFLPAGQEPENPSQVLASNNLDQVIQRMAELFDWIIIDSPPVLTLADPARIAPLCDGVLMVVHANSTPAKMVQKSIQIIGKELICGIVLNRVQNMQASRYYHHYYSGKGNSKK